MGEKKNTKESWGKKLRGQFIAGILVVLPIGVTVLILVWVFTSVDNILQPVFNYFIGKNIPGVGFAATVVLIFIIGAIARNIIGRRILRYAESLLNKVPIFRQLYSSIRQILMSFAAPDRTGFMQVVLAQFPKDGMWTIGFITNEITQQNGELLINVFIPTSPTPWSGFFQIVKEREIIRTDISVEDAIKMVVSCGRAVSEEVRKKIQIK